MSRLFFHLQLFGPIILRNNSTGSYLYIRWRKHATDRLILHVDRLRLVRKMLLYQILGNINLVRIVDVESGGKHRIKVTFVGGLGLLHNQSLFLGE